MKKQKVIRNCIWILCICYLISMMIHLLTKPRNEDVIPILGFHEIVSDEEKDSTYASNMWVDSRSNFLEKMEYLHDQGYTTWTLDELYAWKQGKKEKLGKTIVLTFDDGYASSSEWIAPTLKKYGFHATTFVIGSMVTDTKHTVYLTYDQMKDQSIMQYASHTFALHDQDNGFLMDQKSIGQLREDFEKQKQVSDISYIAYPYGHVNESMLKVCKEYQVKLGFCYHENKMAKRSDDDLQLPRFAITATTSMDSFRAMLEQY